MTDSTDEDPTEEPADKTAPKWLTYELDVKREVQTMEPLAKVTHDAKLTGTKSGVLRQIDVLAERSMIGAPLRVVVECKRYAKKLGIGKVDEFVGKLIDTGAHMGVLYAYSGVTPGAQARADGQDQPSVTVRDLAALVAMTTVVSSRSKTEPHSLELAGSLQSPGAAWGNDAMRALGYEPCANDNCHDPEVGLSPWPSGECAGYCDSCGSLNHQCSVCDEVDLVDGRSTCFGCGSIFDTTFGSDALVDDIVLVEVGAGLDPNLVHPPELDRG